MPSIFLSNIPALNKAVLARNPNAAIISPVKGDWAAITAQKVKQRHIERYQVPYSSEQCGMDVSRLLRDYERIINNQNVMQ